ncbi:DUF302 domain-containing protein [Tepidibacillus infernus]|uniref:DUF302 domain-containing protein n=1 Tax=Tepidibacillus decaturensis TaxID=1413211 RepID=A0A135L1V3_9BACI|nr:DUF302 domain-containing protein [Tepidibacillus decaturensis]KXG42936.1 hypothetical protein U473_02005 [Tepidibacillus decaturensis]
MVHYTVTTRKDMDQLLIDIEAALKEIQFGILWKFDLHEKLEEKGFSSEKEHTVLEVCNPKEASEVLAIAPLSSYFLPCKIVISRDEKETQIGFIRPSVLIGIMENEELIKKGKEIEEKLTLAINQAK